MKYNETNQPLICMQTQSTCFQGTTTMEIKGVLWHSTGANNPNLKRYVQPSENDPNFLKLIETLGKNQNGNDWNHIERYAGLNCWIGKFANGEVGTVQTMPWNYKPWGCGSGKKGSCNNGWIQFEICEADLQDKEYFNKVYKEGCEITAYLCKKFNINPVGTVVYNGVTVPTILCHKDSYDLGLGSGHADITHWFPIYGKSMSSVRTDVLELLNQEKEDEEMTQEKFNEMMNEYLRELATKAPDTWSAEARIWAENNGIVKGDIYGNKQYKKPATREEVVQFLYRLHTMLEE